MTRPGAGAELREGTLADVPMGVLLFALFRERRTVGLELRRRQIVKTVVLDRGVPIECRSNLVHETLGDFLATEGRISAFQAKECLAEASARGVRIGEILVEQGLLDAVDLYRALQRNLAHRLLECFTWSEGSFRLLPELPETHATAKVNVPNLILTGITRFSSPEQVRALVEPLRGRPLALRADPPVAVSELRLGPPQRRLVARLARRREVGDLLVTRDAAGELALRTLAALAALDLVVPDPERDVEVEVDVEVEEQVAEADGERDAREGAAAEPEAWPEGAAAPPSGAEARRICNEIVTEFLAHADKDPFDLLGVGEDAGDAEIRLRYVELVARYAPARFEAPPLQAAAPMADALLQATVTAYAQIRDPALRATLALGRRGPREPRPAPGFSDATGDLAADYARRAFEALDTGNFPAASELFFLALGCDPEDADLRLERAYARFRASGESEPALAAFAAHGGARAGLYAAEACHAAGDSDAAREHFLSACRRWEAGG